MKTLVLALSCIISLATSCSFAASEPVVLVLSRSYITSNGNLTIEVTMAKGDTLVLKLHNNSEAGYGWSEATKSNGSIKETGRRYEYARSGTNGLAYFVISFEVKDADEMELVSYKGYGEVHEPKTIHVKVKISP